MTSNDTPTANALKTNGYDITLPIFYRRQAIAMTRSQGHTWTAIRAAIQAKSQGAQGPQRIAYLQDMDATKNAEHYESVAASQHRPVASL